MNNIIKDIQAIRQQVADLRTKYTQDAWNRDIEQAGITRPAAELRRIHDATYAFEKTFEQEIK